MIPNSALRTSHSEESQLIHLERRTSARTIEQEFRLSGRLARWAGTGALGISLFVIGRPLYRYEAFWVILGALSITLILLSTVGFIVDGLTYWRIAGAQNIERRDYYPSEHNPAPVQLVHRDRNRLHLTRHKLRPAQSARLAAPIHSIGPRRQRLALHPRQRRQSKSLRQNHIPLE